MIQRIQTIWMLLAAFALFLSLKFPFYSGSLADTGAYDTVTATNNLILLILTSAVGTGIVINIFLFKHRSIQFRIIIAALILEILIIYLFIRETANFTAGNFSLWAALHPLVILFLILAAKGIYHDSKIIRESNRLR